jgi:pimeloyl-ACP methyl ester carboxylesterase
MFGISMSGYWGMRAIAGANTKLRALAAFEGEIGDFETMFERAQPSFQANYQYMSGITDEAEFDETLKRQMGIGKMVEQIERPVLVGIGEFDELTPVKNAIATHEAHHCAQGAARV